MPWLNAADVAGELGPEQPITSDVLNARDAAEAQVERMRWDIWTSPTPPVTGSDVPRDVYLGATRLAAWIHDRGHNTILTGFDGEGGEFVPFGGTVPADITRLIGGRRPSVA
jgi:hypothetical protein